MYFHVMGRKPLFAKQPRLRVHHERLAKEMRPLHHPVYAHAIPLGAVIRVDHAHTTRVVHDETRLARGSSMLPAP